MALLARHTRQISPVEKGNGELSDLILFGQRLKFYQGYVSYP